MRWAHIRFTMHPRGTYADRWVVLHGVDDMTSASQMAESLCKGYTLGLGLRASVLQVDSVSHANSLITQGDYEVFGDQIREHIAKEKFVQSLDPTTEKPNDEDRRVPRR